MKTIKEIDTFIIKNVANANFGVAELCAALEISQPQLYRDVKAHTGMSTVKYIRNYRLEQGRILLCSKELTISQICAKIGFNDPAYFSRIFSKEFGICPKKYIKDE